MPQQVSTIVVLQDTENKNRFILVRADFPDAQRRFIWCGRALGWRLWNFVTEVVAKSFRSGAEAQKAADKAVAFPLIQE